MSLATILAPVFFIIFAGFFLRQFRVLSAEADASLMRVYVNLLYPCLIASTILGNPALHNPRNVWLPPLAGFGTVAGGYLVCRAAAWLLRLRHGGAGGEARTFTYITGIYNYGYTAIPVVGSLFGATTLGVLFTYNLGVELAFWTGTALLMSRRAMSREAAREATREGTDGADGEPTPPLWRQILNVPVVTILASVALNFLHLREVMPGWCLEALRMLGACAIPLALLLTGATIRDFLGEARPARRDALPLAAACLLRLGLLPLCFLLLARWLPGSVELQRVLIVQAGMPAAMLPVVFCKHNGGNVGMAIQIVVATTALTLLTLPHWVAFGMRFLGVQ